MRSIITVVGKDTVGILAEVSTLCAKHSGNIIAVTIDFTGYVLYDNAR